MEISDFSFLFTELEKKPKRHLVVANGIDSHSLDAVVIALKRNIVNVTVTGDEKLIRKGIIELNGDVSNVNIIHCNDEILATNCAVEFARNGKADMIMKGYVSTDNFMKSILNKEFGLLLPGVLLSHVTLLRNPLYRKFLIIGDVAIIPLPNIEQKVQITQYLIEIAHKLNIAKPKVAFLAATEKVIKKMPACVDADILKQKWLEGEFPQSYCDGPMALDLAIDKESVEIKNFKSPVAGDADCLLFPNIESGNIFYKTNTKLGNAKTAAIVMGTKVPVILSSRGDSTDTKLNSIAFASIIGDVYE